MFDSIDAHSNVAVYLQIENNVLFAVASGRLKGGNKLPGVRELSEQLKVNPNTIAKSYRDLEVMGVVYARRGMGVFIAKDAEAKCKESCRQRIVARLFEAVAEAQAAAMTLQDIKEICARSFASGAKPYGGVPDAVLAVAKPRKSSKSSKK